MKILELFSGTGSIGKAFKELGQEVFSVDFEQKFNPDLCKDIMEISLDELPKADVIWASPPCQTFSVASLYHHWDQGIPKSNNAIMGRAILYKTLWIIEKLKPTYWFIENPRGMMRKEQLMIYLSNIKGSRKTVTYCQYGDKVQKPTDIWTNCNQWIPRPKCAPGSSCHESAKRGQDKGTQNQSRSPEKRAIIPHQLCQEIAQSCVGNTSSVPKNHT